MNNAASHIKELATGLLHLFYPQLCEGCSTPLHDGEEVLCLMCSLQLPLTDYHSVPDNDTAMRFAGRVPYIQATSFAYFTADGLLQHLMHGLKYHGRKNIGAYLGSQFGKSLAGAGWGNGIDIIIPVPLHPKKERGRGYNQSMLIAAHMGRAMGLPASDSLLLRVKNTASQTSKTRTERVDNMQGAFTIAGPRLVEGKHILLCDDVLTTGATMEACAHALLKAAGVKISFATVGIAV